MTLTSEPMAYLQDIIAKGGPEVQEYDTLNSVFDSISDKIKTGLISDADLCSLQQGFGDGNMDKTILGHVRSKPFGYAGDFLIIDKIYREQVCEDRRFEKWDQFWHEQPACKAVRNRKDYFIRTITEALQYNASLKLLNVASGPARDLAEVYASINPARLLTTCVEADAHAIAYAKELNEAHAAQVEFIHRNIFRFQNEQQYDVVWSAGLFDYFEDRVFIRLLQKFLQWTRPGGEVIIGNFGEYNPSRNYMELIGDWHLHHRSPEALMDMALAAGAQKGEVSVGREEEGVNLFLHICKH